MIMSVVFVASNIGRYGNCEMERSET